MSFNKGRKAVWTELGNCPEKAQWQLSKLDKYLQPAKPEASAGVDGEELPFFCINSGRYRKVNFVSFGSLVGP